MSTFNLAYEEMTDTELVIAIKVKYGYVSRFCKLAKLDVAEFNKMLLIKNPATRSSYFNNVISIAQVTDNTAIKGLELTDEHLCRIKIAIYKKYKNVADFGRQNDISIHWISKLLSGGVVKITDKTKEVAKILKVSLK